VCETGPYAGEICDGFEECAEDGADGVCSVGGSVCQATTFEGTPVSGDNSGRSCTTSEECNEEGFCSVNRCSTDPEGTDSGLCTNKEAGEQCGQFTVTNQYLRLPGTDPASGWDLAAQNPGLVQNPIIRPVVVDPSGSTGFAEGFTVGFTVNGSTSGTIAAQDGRAPISAAFYAYNDNGEQMPLRLILVDWGDGTNPVEARGAFKNHKQLCRTFCSQEAERGRACVTDQDCIDDENPDAQCLPLNFGDSDDACIDDGPNVNGFFSFTHTYTCEGSEPCVYTPKVLVKDNWGATSTAVFPGEIVIQPRVE
jgi:hypothetical protein